MIKIIFVLIFCCISLSDACSCVPLVIKDAYCNSKFAGTIKVLDSGSTCELPEDEEQPQTCYKIVVVKQYRGNVIKPHTLRTADNSAACGVWLEAGHTYFVATNPIDRKTLNLNLCQLKQDWTGLSAAQIKEKAENYNKIQCPNNCN